MQRSQTSRHLIWRLSVLAAMSMCLGLVVASPTSASTGLDARATTGQSIVDGGASSHAQLFDSLPADGRSASRENIRLFRPWSTHVIRYRENLPAKWDWSLLQAFSRWNHTGARLKFKPAKGRAKAQLTIAYGNLPSDKLGEATIGRTRRAFVHLNRTLDADDVDPQSAQVRLEVGATLAHELGHVIGFQHTGYRCGLMSSTYDPECYEAGVSEGYFRCDWVDPKLLSPLVAAYGGRAKPSPQQCLYAPLPAPLVDVAITGGAASGQPTTISWTAPSSLPSDKVRIDWWTGQCGSRPATPASVQIAPSVGRWVDTAFGSGSVCYEVRVTNKYGAARDPVTKQAARRGPPAPIFGPFTYTQHEDGWGWTAVWLNSDPSLILFARGSPDPAMCPTTPQGPSDHVVPVYDDEDPVVVFPDTSPQCVSFFTGVQPLGDEEPSIFSPRTVVTFTTP